MTSPSQSTIDVRTIVPQERHTRIFSTFTALPPGGALELVNDHDPAPLHREFSVGFPGRFTWQYIEQGPQVWRVRIGKTGGGCCGGCGG
ncbi:MAG: DUF2249 domain-containing protein [Steroidobacteraceae bacterium]